MLMTGGSSHAVRYQDCDSCIMLDFMFTSSGSCVIRFCDGGSKMCTMGYGWQELCWSSVTQNLCPDGTGVIAIRGGNKSLTYFLVFVRGYIITYIIEHITITKQT